MMKILNYLIVCLMTIGLASHAWAEEEELSPYLLVGAWNQSMDDAVEKVKTMLEAGNFTVLGDYAPENSPELHVVAFTRKDLQNICLTRKDGGALASILKIGLKGKSGNITVSMLNPMYIFYAYLGDDIEGHENALVKIADDVKTAMHPMGDEFTPFGGSEEPDDLKNYHFMAFMPHFDDPVELHEFNSFDEGVKTINKNLASKKGNTLKVYELIFPEKEIAIFGVGLLDKEEGEAHFLPIIGEDNIAAMPYEIILQGKEASMLHGKFRFAIHWPELSMGQFMKIMSTPGDVEDTMKALTE